MLQSLRILYQAPYNKLHKISALYRFFYWKIIRVLKLKNVAYNIWDDRKFYLSYDSFHSMWVMYNCVVDWEEFNLIKDYLQPNDTAADIGANIGYYSVWMSKFVGQGGMIHAFEPDDINFKRLQENVSLNNLNSIQLNQLALSNEDGVIHFTVGLDWGNHIAITQSEKTVSINSARFDTYCKNNSIENFAYVKVDVEGFEYSVLSGATSLLSQKKIDILQLEINGQVKYSDTTINDLLKLLTDYEYKLCEYDTVKKQIKELNFSPERENYFAVHNIEAVNSRLSKK